MRSDAAPSPRIRLCAGLYVLFVLLAGARTIAFAAGNHADALDERWNSFAPTMALTKTDSDTVVSVADLMLAETVPKPARRLYERALKSDRQGKSEEATQLAHAAIELAPDFVQAHAALAVGYLKRGAFNDAELHAETALGLNPQYVPAREIQGLVLFSRGKYRDAANTLSEVLKLAPGRKTVHYFLGLSLFQLGEEEAADQHFERAELLLREPARRPDSMPGLSTGWPSADSSSFWWRYLNRNWP